MGKEKKVLILYFVMKNLTSVQTSECIIEGQKISYRFRSSKNSHQPLSVFLHGWGSSALSFATLFQENENFVAIDFPGSGKSSPLQKVFTLDDYTRITKKFLQKYGEQESSNFNSFVLIGHSFGGRVIMKLLDVYPEFFSHHTLEKILFIAVPFYKEKTFKIACVGKGVEIAKKIFPKKVLSKVKKMLHTMIGENDYFDLVDDEILQKTFQNIVSDEEEISQYIPLLSTFPPNRLFCFWGKNDTVIPLSFAYRVQEEIGEKFQVIPLANAGHFPWTENKEVFMKNWKNVM